MQRSLQTLIAFKHTFPFDTKWHSNHAESALLLYVLGASDWFPGSAATSTRPGCLVGPGVSVSRSDT